MTVQGEDRSSAVGRETRQWAGKRRCHGPLSGRGKRNFFFHRDKIGSGPTQPIFQAGKGMGREAYHTRHLLPKLGVTSCTPTLYSFMGCTGTANFYFKFHGGFVSCEPTALCPISNLVQKIDRLMRRFLLLAFLVECNNGCSDAI
jgi:hypothetical protein